MNLKTFYLFDNHLLVSAGAKVILPISPHLARYVKRTMRRRKMTLLEFYKLKKNIDEQLTKLSQEG